MLRSSRSAATKRDWPSLCATYARNGATEPHSVHATHATIRTLNTAQSSGHCRCAFETPEKPAGGRLFRDYLAQAYASTRGSAPALRTPVFGSMAMAAFEPNDHAPADCSL